MSANSFGYFSLDSGNQLTKVTRSDNADLPFRLSPITQLKSGHLVYGPALYIQNVDDYIPLPHNLIKELFLTVKRMEGPVACANCSSETAYTLDDHGGHHIRCSACGFPSITGAGFPTRQEAIWTWNEDQTKAK